MRSALASGLSRRQAIMAGGSLALLAQAGPRGRAGLRAGAHAAVALRLFGLAAEPAALGQRRRLGRHGEDADPRPPHRLRPGRQARRRAGRKLRARRGRRLGVPARSERDLPQRRSGHVGRRQVHDRADRRREVDRLHARPVPGRSRASRRPIRAPSASTPSNRSRRCRPGSPTTTCRSCRRSRPRPSSSAAAPTSSMPRSAARRSSSSPTTSISSPACRASSASASSSMRTRTCASPRCSPATWT